MSNQDVKEYDTQLGEIDRELVELQGRREHLQAKRVKVTQSRFDFIATNRLAPWRIIPTQLLGDIFVLVNEQDEVFEFPTIISLVCSEWQAIANMTPLLWTHIHITGGQRGLHTAHTWLARAKHASITFVCTFDEDATTLPEMKLIVSHLSRVSGLYIRCGTEAQATKVIKALSIPAPLLRKLRLIAIDPEEFDPQFRIADNVSKGIFAGGNAPNLRVLEILSPHSEWPAGMTKSLTRLVLTIHGEQRQITPILQLLRNMPCLSHLTLIDHSAENDMQYLDDSPLEPVTLPALVDAHLEGNWVNQPLLLLHYLHLPKIHSLHIGGESIIDELETVPENMTPFPHLKSLSFFMEVEEDPDAMREHLPRLLQRCEGVESIHLYTTTLPVEVLHQNLPSSLADGTQPMCPNLTEIRLSQYFLPSDPNLMETFIWKRFIDERVKSIKSLTISNFAAWSVRPSKQEVAGLRHLVDVLHIEGDDDQEHQS